MVTQILMEIFDRDLERLHAEIVQYAAEPELWKAGEGISNSGGNLALHICGNLQHFIGAVLGGSGYARQRDAEFAQTGVARELLLQEIGRTRGVVRETLERLTADDLEKTYPIDVLGSPMSTEFFLVHLTTHLNYHLGQINYHRRLSSSGADAR